MKTIRYVTLSRGYVGKSTGKRMTTILEVSTTRPAALQPLDIAVFEVAGVSSNPIAIAVLVEWLTSGRPKAMTVHQILGD